MMRTIIRIVLYSLFVWLLAACAPLSQTAAVLPESAETDASVHTGSFAEPGQEPSRCVEPAIDQRLWVDEVHAYCLIVPETYVAWSGAPGAVSLVKGDIMNHLDPRIEITVIEGAESTPEEAADQWAADFGIPGFTVERSRITVDGVDAVMLDNLPGQDLNRRIVVVHNGRLYGFFFRPLDAAMAPFYATALDSFRFLDGPSGEPSLVYAGPVEVGNDDPSKCTGMSLDGSQGATLFSCDGTSTSEPLGKRLALDWADFQTRFDAFTYDTPTETLVFDGVGEPASEPWQRAILSLGAHYPCRTVHR